MRGEGEITSDDEYQNLLRKYKPESIMASHKVVPLHNMVHSIRPMLVSLSSYYRFPDYTSAPLVLDDNTLLLLCIGGAGT